MLLAGKLQLLSCIGDNLGTALQAGHVIRWGFLQLIIQSVHSDMKYKALILTLQGAK